MGKMTAKKAFPILFARIRWIETKIIENKLRGVPTQHYRDEVNALCWIMDRLIEQTRRLAERQNMPVDALVSVLKQHDALENELTASSCYLSRADLVEKAARIAEWQDCTCECQGATRKLEEDDPHLSGCPKAIGWQIREELKEDI